VGLYYFKHIMVYLYKQMMLNKHKHIMTSKIKRLMQAASLSDCSRMLLEDSDHYLEVQRPCPDPDTAGLVDRPISRLWPLTAAAIL
jgi:hypothetical protein